MLRSFERTVPQTGFSGLNDTWPRRAIRPDQLSDCNNVVCSDGSVRVRPPWTTYASGPALGFSASDGRLLEAQVFRIRDFTAATKTILMVLRQIISTSTSRWYAIDITTGTPGTPLGAIDSPLGETDGHPTQCCQFNNAIFAMSNNARATKFYYDSTNTLVAQVVGIVTPVTPVAIGSSAAGTLAVGSYSWRYTYYNSVTGAESGPSPTVTHTVTGAGDDEFTFIIVPAVDAQVTNMRVYRLEEGVTDTWYYLSDASASGTFFSDDGSMTPDVTVAGRVPLSERIVVGNAAAIYKGRMWVVVNATGEVEFSEYDLPEQSLGVVSRLRITDGEPLVRLLPALNGLLAFSHTGLWIINGDDPDSFTVTKLLEVGCRAPHSVVQVNEDVYWANEWGAHKLGPGGYRVITDPVRTGWTSFLKPEIMGVAYDRVRNLLLFHQEDSNGSRTMVYDLRTGQSPGNEQDIWWRWHGSDDAIKGVAGVELSRDRPLVLALRKTTDLVRLSDSYGGTDFASTAIAWSMETGDLDFGTGWRKRLNYLRVRRNVAPSGTDTATIAAGFNGGTLESGTSHDFYGSFPSVNKLFGRGDVETVRIKLSGNANVATAVIGLDFDLTPEGHR